MAEAVDELAYLLSLIPEGTNGISPASLALRRAHRIFHRGKFHPGQDPTITPELLQNAEDTLGPIEIKAAEERHAQYQRHNLGKNAPPQEHPEQVKRNWKKSPKRRPASKKY